MIVGMLMIKDFVGFFWFFDGLVCYVVIVLIFFIVIVWMLEDFVDFVWCVGLEVILF